jgi:hypothetical protein
MTMRTQVDQAVAEERTALTNSLRQYNTVKAAATAAAASRGGVLTAGGQQFEAAALGSTGPAGRALGSTTVIPPRVDLEFSGDEVLMASGLSPGAYVPTSRSPEILASPKVAPANAAAAQLPVASTAAARDHSDDGANQLRQSVTELLSAAVAVAQAAGAGVGAGVGTGVGAGVGGIAPGGSSTSGAAAEAGAGVASNLTGPAVTVTTRTVPWARYGEAAAGTDAASLAASGGSRGTSGAASMQLPMGQQEPGGISGGGPDSRSTTDAKARLFLKQQKR